MLEKLTLRQFQCHEKLVVRLGRITTLCGKSDAGKSSTLRAIRLLARNAPGGTAFVHHARRSCRVVIVAEGRKVARTKGEGTNSYHLDGAEYKALGTGSNAVPQAVQNVLRTDDINFQLQHDAPFWFGDTPGQVSKALNRIVNLDVIDTTLAKAATAVRQATAVEEVTATRVKEAEEAVKKLEWVKGFDAALSKVISARDAAAEVDNKCERLETLLVRHAETVAEKKRYSSVWKAFSEVEGLAGIARQMDDDYETLRTLLRAHRAEVERGKAQIGAFGPVEDARGEGDRIAENCGRLERLMDQYKQAEEQLCQARAEQKELEKKLGDRCPSCGATLKSSASSRPTCTYPKRHR